MPDQHIPQRWRPLLRYIRAALYVTLAAAGIADMFLTVDNPFALTGPLAYWWAILLTGGAVAAGVGVVIDRYRVEWLATWPIMGGLLIYALTVWAALIAGQLSRGTQATLSLALLIALILRSAELAAVAARLRAEHFDTEAIRVRRRRRNG